MVLTVCRYWSVKDKASGDRKWNACPESVEAYSHSFSYVASAIEVPSAVLNA